MKFDFINIKKGNIKNVRPTTADIWSANVQSAYIWATCLWTASLRTGPTVIRMNGNNYNEGGSPCQLCGTNTAQVTRKKVGCVAIMWGICLLWTTGFLCCLPCCMDSCKDTELVCVKCQQVKTTIEANCC